MKLGRFDFPLIIAQQSEQQPGAEMIALFIESAAQMNCGIERFAEMEIIFADRETEFGVLLVQRESVLERPQPAASAAFGDEQRSLFDQVDEILAGVPAIGRNDLLAALVEAFALSRLFIVARYAVAPALLELVGVDRAHLGQDFGQG